MRDCHLKHTNDRVVGHLWAYASANSPRFFIYITLIPIKYNSVLQIALL